jgi:hypothetical protein
MANYCRAVTKSPRGTSMYVNKSENKVFEIADTCLTGLTVNVAVYIFPKRVIMYILEDSQFAEHVW